MDTSVQHVVRNIPLHAIAADPKQPRREFDEEALQGLADSIREEGLIQPIVVRPFREDDPQDQVDQNANPDLEFRLIAGERRWRASKLAQLTEIAAIIRDDLLEDSTIVLQLVENLQKADLTLVEECQGCNRLVNELGFTLSEAAAKLGKSKTWVSLRTTASELPVQIWNLVLDGRIGSIDVAHDLAKLKKLYEGRDGKWRVDQIFGSFTDPARTPSTRAEVRAAVQEITAEIERDVKWAQEREEINQRNRDALEAARKHDEAREAGKLQPASDDDESAADLGLDRTAARNGQDDEDEEDRDESAAKLRRGQLELLGSAAKPMLYELALRLAGAGFRFPKDADTGEFIFEETYWEDDENISLSSDLPPSYGDDPIPESVEDIAVMVQMKLKPAQLRALVDLFTGKKPEEKPAKTKAAKKPAAKAAAKKAAPAPKPAKKTAAKKPAKKKA